MAKIANIVGHLFLTTNNEVIKQKLNKLCENKKKA